MSGAAVQIEKTDRAATTDLNGDFRFNSLQDGTYVLVVAHQDFRPSIVTDMIVVAGATVRHTVPLTPVTAAVTIEATPRAETDEIVQLEALTVSGTATQGSELSLLADRQKSSTISDAIGEDAISRLDVGDAAEAMSKVTGASIVDGKYVLIRGLGDRYSNTLLNGMSVPSADPDRRAVQMDQFPSSLLESIVTSKSFTADQPGGFAGGSVNLRTKYFPERFFASLSTSVSYNTATTGKDTLVIPGGGRDWTGRDDGTRALPEGLPAQIPSQTEARIAARSGNFAPAEELHRVSNLFHNDTYFPAEKTADPNFGFSMATGNRHDFSGDRTLGYIVSLTYDRSTEHDGAGYISQFVQGSVDPASPFFVNENYVYSPNLDDFSYADDFRANPDVAGGEPQFGITRSSQNVDWGAYAQLAYKPALNHEFSLRFLHNQSATDEVTRGVGESTRSESGRMFSIYELLYTERTLDSFQLTGRSVFPGWNDVRVEWRAAHSKSTQEEPDFRTFSYFWDFALEQFATASGTGSNRYFRDLEEASDEAGLDVFVPFTLRGRASTIKFGGMWQDGARTNRERIFRWSTPLTQLEIIENFPNPVGIVDRTATSVTFGNTISESTVNLANYDGAQTISAGYAMADLGLSERWRAILGVRAESTEISTSAAPGATVSFRSGAIDQTDLLPAVSAVYQMNDTMNLRFAYGRTIARPLYHELADVRVPEFKRGKDREGNPFLEVTTIDNFDVRWEWFRRPNEIIAVSAFYKDFTNPIEVLDVPLAGAERPQNLESGSLYGVEFEARFGLGEITPVLANFSAGANFTLMRSESAIPDDELAALRATFPDTKSTRELFNQSPYIVNLDLGYRNMESGTSVTLAYNLVGERLKLVTQSALPDVYEQPAPELDLIVSQTLSARWRLKLSAKNLLNPAHEQTLSYSGQDYYYERFKIGRTFTLGLSYLFE